MKRICIEFIERWPMPYVRSVSIVITRCFLTLQTVSYNGAQRFCEAVSKENRHQKLTTMLYTSNEV